MAPYKYNVKKITLSFSQFVFSQIKISFTVFLLILFTIVLLSGCRNKAVETYAGKTMSDTLEAFILQQKQVSKTVILPSQLEAFEKAELYAKIPGYIKKINVDIGEKVKAGATLAIIEAAEYQANLSQAIASAQAAKAQYQSSKDAYERLLKAAQQPGAVAERELVQAKNKMLADSAAYKASHEAATAYNYVNNYLIIKAPFSGIVTQRNADPGDFVGSTNTKPLFIIENNETLRLKVPVPELYTNAAETKEVKFNADAIPNNDFTAILYRKSNTIDLSNRTELWEFLVNNKNHLLRSGMYANVTLPLSRKNVSLVVPYSAIATTLEKNFVIKYTNGIAKWIDVRSGINMDTLIEVFGNLLPGDTLLLKATDEIKNNQNIQIVLKEK